jgi:hypothetical protein
VSLAINYAFLAGASRIVTLGLDGRCGPGRERRFGSREQDTPGSRERYRHQEDVLRAMMIPLRFAGVEVVNCSPDTAVRCFPVAALEDVI